MKTTYNQFYITSIYLILIVELLIPKLIALPLILFFLVILVGGFQKKLKFVFHLSMFFLLLYYLAYLGGSYFTFRPEIAAKYIENKISFLLFPLFFSWVPKEKVSLKLLPLVFTSSIIILSVFCFAGSYSCYQFSKHSISCFFSSFFSSIHHPTYFSMFILGSGFLNWYAWFHRWRFVTLYWVIPVTLYYLFIYFLCFSLAGLIFLLLFLGVLTLLGIYKKFGKLVFFISLVLVPIGFITFFKSVPKYQLEIRLTGKAVKLFINDSNSIFRKRDHEPSGNEARLMMWCVSYEIIKDHPLGVGTGNLDDYLHKGLIEHDEERLAQKDYNPHNQFLQTTAEIGILGLLILLLFLFFAFKQAFNTNNYFLIVLLCTLVFNSLFESVLQLQSGIVFFSFMICFLVGNNIKSTDGH